VGSHHGKLHAQRIDVVIGCVPDAPRVRERTVPRLRSMRNLASVDA
jgi:hypothetical protein